MDIVRNLVFGAFLTLAGLLALGALLYVEILLAEKLRRERQGNK